MHDLWVGSKNSALCVTTLDPKSRPVQMTHLGTKSKFIIITHYAAICKSSLPSVVPNNQKSLQAGNAHSLNGPLCANGQNPRTCTMQLG